MNAHLDPEYPVVAPEPHTQWFKGLLLPVVAVQPFNAKVAPVSNPPFPVGLIIVVCPQTLKKELT